MLPDSSAIPHRYVSLADARRGPRARGDCQEAHQGAREAGEEEAGGEAPGALAHSAGCERESFLRRLLWRAALLTTSSARPQAEAAAIRVESTHIAETLVDSVAKGLTESERLLVHHVNNTQPSLHSAEEASLRVLSLPHAGCVFRLPLLRLLRSARRRRTLRSRTRRSASACGCSRGRCVWFDLLLR